MGRKRALTRKIEVRVFLDSVDVEVVDRMISDGAYTNRSDAVRDIVRNAIRRQGR